jgi:hypothetical protein
VDTIRNAVAKDWNRETNGGKAASWLKGKLENRASLVGIPGAL